MTETFIKSFTHLRDMPKADRASPMLRRVATLVKPIMRKHGWVLLTLAEFFPDSPNLLGESKLFLMCEIVLPIVLKAKYRRAE